MSTKEKSRKAAGPPPVNRPGATRAADPDAVRLLAFIAEQGSLTVAHLGRLASIAESEASRRVGELVELGWARRGIFTGWEGEWVWLRAGGVQRSGTGLRRAHMKSVQIGHRHAITEARLALREEFPDAVWVCERELWRRCRGRGCVPDGLLEVGGERVAVEVELSVKPVAVVERLMAERCENFDRVIYFCGPWVRSRILGVRESVGAEQVIVRDLAAPLLGACRTRNDRRRFEPEPEELAALRVISEEGLVAARQLGLLLGTGEAEGLALADRLEERNLVRRNFEVDGDGGWLHTPRRPSFLSGTGLLPFRPTSPVGLARRLGLAQIRADWLAGSGRRRWSTRRMLIKGLAGPRRSDVPDAVAESGCSRFAVVIVDPHFPSLRVSRDLAVFAASFDGVLCYAGPMALERVRRLVAEGDFPGVVVSSLP